MREHIIHPRNGVPYGVLHSVGNDVSFAHGQGPVDNDVEIEVVIEATEGPLRLDDAAGLLGRSRRERTRSAIAGENLTLLSAWREIGKFSGVPRH